MHHGPDLSVVGARTPPPIDFQLTDMEAVLSELVLTVNEMAPFPILHASQGWLDFFRFSKEEILGRSLRVINGPNTDIHLLQDIIQSTPDGKQRAAAITLYSSAGQENVMVVKALRQYGCCTLTMTASDAISSQQATTQVEKSRMLVTANEPYFVQQISTGFSRMFGLCGQEIVNRTIRMLDGPHTDILAFQQLLMKAKTGFAQRGTIVAFTKDCVELVCEVELVPVVGQGGTISHLQIDFAAQAQNPVQPFQPNFEEQWQGDDATTSSHRPNVPQWPHIQADGFAQLPPVHIGAPWPVLQPGRATSQPAHSALNPIEMAPSPHAPGATATFALGHAMAGGQMLQGAHQPQDSAMQAAQPPSRLTSAPATFQQDFGIERKASVMQTEGAPSRASSAMSEVTRTASSRASRASSSASESASGVGRSDKKGERSSLRLFPRRKAGESDLKALGGPVDLSKEIVDEFVGMSMKEAAQKLGISASAMKKACRKLGVKKWPHKSTKSSVDVMTYNSAYVRRLYSKYAEKDQTAGGRDDPLHHPSHAHGPGSPHAASDISEGSEGAASDSSPCQTPAPGGSGHGQRHGHMATPSVVWDRAWQTAPPPMQGGGDGMQAQLPYPMHPGQYQQADGGARGDSMNP